MRNKFKINGRRGAFQILFAAVYLVVGGSFLWQPGAGTRQAALAWITDYVQIQPLSALWIGAGVIGAVSAFQCRPRDWFGFAALVFAPAVWGALFFIGGFTSGVSGFTSATVYWLFAAAPMIVAGMQGDADRDRRKTPHD